MVLFFARQIALRMVRIVSVWVRSQVYKVNEVDLGSVGLSVVTGGRTAIYTFIDGLYRDDVGVINFMNQLFG